MDDETAVNTLGSCLLLSRAPGFSWEDIERATAHLEFKIKDTDDLGTLRDLALQLLTLVGLTD